MATTWSVKKASGVRYPRAFMARLAKHVYDTLRPHLNSDDQIFFGGSLVRQCETCGDLDLCIRNDDEKSYFAVIEAFNALGENYHSGASVRHAAIPFEDQLVQADLWIYEPAGWGVGCMFVAGSGVLNILQRQQAARQGYSIGKYLMKGQQIIPCSTEREVYQTLGWNWIKYPDRNL